MGRKGTMWRMKEYRVRVTATLTWGVPIRGYDEKDAESQALYEIFCLSSVPISDLVTDKVVTVEKVRDGNDDNEEVD